MGLPTDNGSPDRQYRPGPDNRVHTKKWNPPNPLHASEQQWQSLFLAARARTPFSARIGEDVQTKAMGEMGLTTKAAVGEGASGSLLPPVLLPDAFPLRYETDRLFSAFPGLPAESQSVSYLQHTGNTNPAAPVAELTQKPDLGMQVESQTTTFTLIAALATFSRQLLDDFQDFYSFVPTEMYRAVIDAETNQLVNGSGTAPSMEGILATSGLLTRALGTDTVINALVKACNDLRVGSSYATADLIAMHPSTWTKVKTQTDTQGRYLLNINASDVGAIDNVFGVPVLTNTKIPIGTGIVFDTTIAIKAWTRMALEMMTNPYGDTEFATNAITFRAEERIAIGVIRPTAINVVTGLGS
jgi:HK97 family phage major capsid protein